MSALSRFLGEDAAAILSGKAFPDITPPDGLEVTEYRDTALQPGNTDIQVSESAYYPAAKDPP